MKNLEKKIKNKSAKIAVIGIGYVGLPVACLLAKAGFRVTGINRGKEKVDLVNSGISPIEGKEPGLSELVKEVVKSGKLTATTDYSFCRQSDIVLIAVETPVDERTKTPRYEALRSAFKKIIADMPHVKYAVVIDADMQYSPEESIRFLDVLRNDKADFVMGYRDFSKVPFRHKMGNFMWRNVFNLMFGTKLRDANCGFIALSRRAVSAVVEKIHGGYIIEDSMLAECVRRKFIIEQVPVSVSYARLSGVFRGIRVVAGVLVFILTEGLRYRLRFS